MPLSIDRQADDSGATLAVAGEIDMATRPDLVKALEAVFAEGVRSVTVDLAGVTFMDCFGMSALIHGRELAADRACGYRVVGATGMPLLVLRMTGVLAELA
jgi:anti-sigma B factor antagonist